MFCPNCGARNGKKQNYCRFCGLGLRDVTKALISQLAFGEDSDSVKSLGSVRRVIDLALALVAGVIIVSAVAYFFFKSGFGKDLMKMGAVIFLLLETILGAAGYYQRKERSKARARQFEQNKTERLESEEAIRFLEEKPLEVVPSVVEGPTELLPLESKKRKLNWAAERDA